MTGHVEAAALALAQVALLSERRLHRLLDARFSGLSPQLARRPGLDAGLVDPAQGGARPDCAYPQPRGPAIAPAGRVLIRPGGLHDHGAPGPGPFARDRPCRFGGSGYEIYAALVAVDQRGDKPGRGVAVLRAAVRLEIPAYAGDRPYGPEIDQLVALIAAGRLPLPAMA
jgi:hypothetical protein